MGFDSERCLDLRPSQVCKRGHRAMQLSMADTASQASDRPTDTRLVVGWTMTHAVAIGMRVARILGFPPAYVRGQCARCHRRKRPGPSRRLLGEGRLEMTASSLERPLQGVESGAAGVAEGSFCAGRTVS